jgi:hypothetical protein
MSDLLRIARDEGSPDHKRWAFSQNVAGACGLAGFLSLLIKLPLYMCSSSVVHRYSWLSRKNCSENDNRTTNEKNRAATKGKIPLRSQLLFRADGRRNCACHRRDQIKATGLRESASAAREGREILLEEPLLDEDTREILLLLGE